jgi:hypothetical protein
LDEEEYRTARGQSIKGVTSNDEVMVNTRGKDDESEEPDDS